ncbi:hypothetical protein GCM10010492_03400 [Saccharothrix mutabilis subsp. mutabilis]|uniref:IrrE N-terminal-like domain-containing protein n=1 Tax=Saccharothrix mutabilis subsp. mutabilis TaxID=66855 RepID=A0ABN0T188_9PSEU
MVRGRITAAIEGVEIPRPFDIEEFARRLGEHRGRPIHLFAVELPPANDVRGLWLATGTEDFVFHELGTSKLHQENTILHEFAHMLLDHRGNGHLDEEQARVFFPDLDPGAVRDVFGRSAYSSALEREAEFGAAVLWELVGRRLVPERRLDLASAAVVDRFDEVLGGTR